MPSYINSCPWGPDAFAISTIKAGIVIFDRTGKIIRAINTRMWASLDNTVLDLMVDRSNNLWAATNLGISHIELSVPQSVFGVRNGIDNVSLSACFHNGRLYVGTYQNLFVQVPYRFTLKDDLPKYVAIKDGPNGIWQFLEAEGDLLAASSDGLFRIQNEAAFKVSSSFSSLCLGVSRRWPGHLFVGLMGGLKSSNALSGQWTMVGKDGWSQGKHRAHYRGCQWRSLAEHRGQRSVAGPFSGGKPTEVVVHGFGPEQGLPGLTELRASFHGSTLYVVSPKGLFRANIQPWNAEGTDRTRFAPDLALGKAFSDPPTAISNMVSYGQGGFLFNTSAGVVLAVPGKDGQYKMITRPFQGFHRRMRRSMCTPKAVSGFLGKYSIGWIPWPRRTTTSPSMS